MPTPQGNRIRLKRLEERERIFGDCGQLVWDYKHAKGYAPVPRILPLILRLLTKDGGKAKGNPGRVYHDLWSRSFDAGFLKLDDEDSAAYSAGYDGERGTRTWRDHMRYLVEQGFIRVERNGFKEFGYILLIDPFRVVASKIKSGALSDRAWINAFTARCSEIGAVLPDELKAALKFRHEAKAGQREKGSSS